ncbi:hypothetical protein OHQ88_33710 (plasmid) [Micromonospora zamorensis]|uniref:hypothetical protein n=1 Tax=Micromonospora zamorensis TaxID=709883 RepID=UPI002E23C15E
MSTRALRALQQLWRNLEFFTVDRVEAREPDDVQYINLRKPPIGSYPDGTPMYNGSLPIERSYRRLSDVPQELRPHAQIVWRSYQGYTTSGVQFTKDHYNELDFQTDKTLTFGTWLNHTSSNELPPPGQLICGERATTGDGPPFLRRWFVCDRAFQLLLTSVTDGLRHTEAELGQQLLSKKVGFPDTYFAVARLVFFDNVQAFVDGIKVGRPSPSVGQLFMGEPATISAASPYLGLHPAHDSTYAGGWPVDWRGMYLATGYAQQVHELSRTLNEPQWWADFLRLAAEQGVVHSHPGRGGVCHACIAEQPDWTRTGFPYQFEYGAS